MCSVIWLNRNIWVQACTTELLPELQYYCWFYIWINVCVYFHNVTLELLCECGRNVGKGTHSPDVCAFGGFFSLRYIFEMKQLAGYFRPSFCLLRACWPYCPSASTSWTCTTVLPTLRRRLVKRLDWRGRTFSTSSMNCWVSDDENLHVCSLWPFSSFPLCHNQSHLWNLPFLFIHGMRLFLHLHDCREKSFSVKDNICTSPSGSVFAFHEQNARCWFYLFLSVLCSGGIFSSLHQLWARIHHFLSGKWLIKRTLWKSKSLYSTFTRLHSGVSPKSGEQNLHELFIDLVFFLSIWVSDHVTGLINWNPHGEKWASGERRHLKAHLRIFNSTSAFIFQLEFSALCFCLSCSDTWKQNQLHSVFPQVGLASQQAGEAGVFIRYQTSLVVSVCVYT